MPIAYRKNAPPGGGRQPRESSSTSRSRTMPGMPLNAGSMPNVARLCTCSVFVQPVRDHADTKMHALERLAAQHVPATMRAALLAMCGMHSMGSEWNARTVSERCARFRRPSVAMLFHLPTFRRSAASPQMLGRPRAGISEGLALSHPLLALSLLIAAAHACRHMVPSTVNTVNNVHIVMCIMYKNVSSVICMEHAISMHPVPAGRLRFSS